ncbi:MAG: hypothetical protein ACR5LG_06605 [Sodalis sp. (in: enterobacteria)]|uniref:hypothetical protein n=1 Tax=Sodalis sp. (in: enterobacteria) TaxID=1898979 RepID=UPI003F34E7A1
MANKELETVIKNPRSRDPSVSVDVDVSIRNAEFISFTAMPTDIAGKGIYKRAIAGEYGAISLIPARDYYWSNSEWTAPTQEELTRIAEGRKATLMQEASVAT